MDSRIEQVFTALISPDNQVRERAEEEFEKMCKENTKETLMSILKCSIT